MWTTRSLLPPGIAIARLGCPNASWWTPGTPQRIPLVSGNLSPLDEPVPPEFRRIQSSFPDLGTQRVGADPKLRSGFPEGHWPHRKPPEARFKSSANSYANRYVTPLPDPSAARALKNGAASGCDRMFGMVRGYQ